MTVDERRSGPPLEVVVGTMPAGPNLFPEISLVKPALLYADSVRLLSPMATILNDFATASQLEGVDRADLMIQMAAAIGDDSAVEQMEAIKGAISMAALPRAQRRRLLGASGSRDLRDLIKELDSGWKRLQDQLGEQLTAAGAPELEHALTSGIVQLEPLVDSDTQEFNDIFVEFLVRLSEILGSTSSYPLFDDRTGSLVSAGLAEGLFRPHRETELRGKEVGAAAQLLQYVPAFPHATIPEILEIRGALESPLIRFRAAMAHVAQLIDSSPHSEEFTSEVERIYRAEIVPALQEIRVEVEENTFLRQLLGEAIKDIPKWLGAGFVTFAFTPSSNIPELVIAGASAVEPTVKAVWNKKRQDVKIREHQYFLLYEVQHLLHND